MDRGADTAGEGDAASASIYLSVLWQKKRYALRALRSDDDTHLM